MSRSYHTRQDNHFKFRLYLTDEITNSMQAQNLLGDVITTRRVWQSAYILTSKFIAELDESCGKDNWRYTRKGNDRIRIEFRHEISYVEYALRFE